MYVGFWIFPTLVTIIGAILASRVPTGGDYNFMPGLAWLAWAVVSAIVWMMYGVSWLF